MLELTLSVAQGARRDDYVLEVGNVGGGALATYLVRMRSADGVLAEARLKDYSRWSESAEALVARALAALPAERQQEESHGPTSIEAELVLASPLRGQRLLSWWHLSATPVLTLEVTTLSDTDTQTFRPATCASGNWRELATALAQARPGACAAHGHAGAVCGYARHTRTRAFGVRTTYGPQYASGYQWRTRRLLCLGLGEFPRGLTMTAPIDISESPRFRMADELIADASAGRLSAHSGRDLALDAGYIYLLERAVRLGWAIPKDAEHPVSEAWTIGLAGLNLTAEELALSERLMEELRDRYVLPRQATRQDVAAAIAWARRIREAVIAAETAG